ncbi:SWIM zinc finger family protein [Bradyrhizobium sp. WSM 1738]|uniref:SWIM zinc finger family protein n=1 Tax=Bradyrhizobium hereditatis TaxID=2821405 RepID=UPI001CE32C00|nr:SWIM zinc finger family protein [Bradyrhizobium hereditatis]MCA6117258.1 SWIM zinc finger family protein [Bradyrhizobium hereditatis]
MSPLIPLYAQIDESALEAMASRGIVRRARTDAANVRFESMGAEEIVCKIEGATVRLDDKGLAKARCSCPAATTCRHKIAVVLALRTLAGEQQAASAVEIDWLARLSTFDRKTLQSAVGKTGLREAMRLLALAEATTVEAGKLTLKVMLRLNSEDIEVAIPAQGDFTSVVSGLPERRRLASHAAAILAARGHFGLEAITFDEAEAVADQKEFVPDALLLTAMQDAVRRAYAQGFAFPSRALEERLMLLAVSSRAEAMPRLSASLRRIAEGLEQRRSRNVNHDAVELLREIAFAHALLHAMSQTRDDGRLRRLAGTVRAEYEPVGDVDLIGLGATLFETMTGAAGVTAHFIEPTTGRRFTASLARGTTHDTRFDPRAAYRTQAVWGKTLAELSSAAYRLSGAHASSTGRLSLSQASRADAIQPFRPNRELVTAWAQDRNGQLADLTYMSWPILADYLGRCFAPSLDRPLLSAQPVILVPSRIAPVTFDDLTQRLRWPLMDVSGAWISLTLDHDDEGRGLGASRIAALEAAIGDGDNKRPFAIVAIARPEGGKIILEPIALWGETQMSLDFPDRILRQSTDVVSRIMAGLRRRVAQFAPPPPADVTMRQTTQLLQAGIDALISFAEAGLHGSARERLLAPLAKTYQLASLPPLAQLLLRTIESSESDISPTALAAAQGVFTLQSFTSRLQVWT